MRRGLLNPGLLLSLVGVAFVVDVCVRRPYYRLGGITLWFMHMGLANAFELYAGMIFLFASVWLFSVDSKTNWK
jgi:hypothetical protein